jgi:hypothetical protein
LKLLISFSNTRAYKGWLKLILDTSFSTFFNSAKLYRSKLLKSHWDLLDYLVMKVLWQRSRLFLPIFKVTCSACGIVSSSFNTTHLAALGYCNLNL